MGGKNALAGKFATTLDSRPVGSTRVTAESPARVTAFRLTLLRGEAEWRPDEGRVFDLGGASGLSRPGLVVRPPGDR
jgi:hypothetical protein